MNKFFKLRKKYFTYRKIMASLSSQRTAALVNFSSARSVFSVFALLGICLMTACGGNESGSAAANAGSNVISDSPLTSSSTAASTSSAPAVTSSSSSVEVFPNPLISYKFDVPLGPNSSVLDQSGYGNDGKLKGSGASVSNGVMTFPGGAFGSDGAYIEVPTSALTGKNDLTITIWLRDTTRAVHHSAAYIGNTDVGKGYWLLNPESPNGYAKSVLSATSGGAASEVGARGSSGWQHRSCMHAYTTVINGTTRSMALFVDGSKVVEAAIPASVQDYGDLVAYIGKSPYSDSFFRGEIASFAIYGSAVDEGTVTALWRQKALDSASECVTVPTEAAEDFRLAATATGTNISWKVVSNAALIDIVDGEARLKRPAQGAGSATATLEANFTDGVVTRTKTYEVKILEDISGNSSFGALARRAESGIDIVGGQYVLGQPGYVAGDWCLMGRDTNVILEGTGYVRVRWELEFWYGWGQIAMPEITALSDETQIIRVGEGGQYDQKIGYNMSVNSPELGYHDWYIWFSGRISIVNHERIASTAHWQSPYTASYNLGIGRSWYDQANSNSAVKYDNSTGYLPPSSYKISSRGRGYNDYWNQLLVEARDRAFDPSLPVEQASRLAYRALDSDMVGQWWTITPKPGGYYIIVNQMNGMALGVSENLSGRYVASQPLDGSSLFQRWRIKRASNGGSIADDTHYTLVNVGSGLALSDDGTNISQQAPLVAGYQQSFLLRFTYGYPESLIQSSKQIVGFDRYESEGLNNIYKSSAEILGNAAISGTRYVTLYDADSYLSYSVSVPASGNYLVKVHYAEEANSVQNVYVNDQLVGQISYSATSSYPAGAHGSVSRKIRFFSGTGATQELTLNLRAGANVIRFQSTANSLLEHDYVDIAQSPS